MNQSWDKIHEAGYGSALPPHLRDDAPFLTCTACGRKSWSLDSEGERCGMPLPDGAQCGGVMKLTGAPTALLQDWQVTAAELAQQIERAGYRRGRDGRAPSDSEPEIVALLAWIKSHIAPAAPTLSPAIGTRYRIEFDGFVGDVRGHYIRRDGEPGVVMQQDGTNIMHVYRNKWLQPAAPAPLSTQR